MRRTVLTFAAAAVLLCAGASTHGGIYEQSFEFSLMGGIQSGDSDASVASDASYGLRIGYAMTPKLQIEVATSKFDTERDVTGFAGDPAQPTEQVEFSRTTGTTFTYYSVGLTANFLTETDSRTIPFLSVGLGATVQEQDGDQFCIDLNPDSDPNALGAIGCDDIAPDGHPVDPNSGITNPDDEVTWVRSLDSKDTGTLLTIALGARTFIAEWMAIRYEARYYHHDGFDENQDAFEGTVGASFVFGGRR